MKEQIAAINNKLGDVHTVLTNLILKASMDDSRIITDEDLERINEAEELLEVLRTELTQLSA